LKIHQNQMSATGCKLKGCSPAQSHSGSRYDVDFTFHYTVCFASWTSAVIFTSSLTSTPPVSRAAFQFRPHSLRLILPSMEKPAFSLPQGSLLIPPNSTFRETSFSTSFILSIPVSVYCPSPAGFHEVLRNSMCGKFSESKKSPDLR